MGEEESEINAPPPSSLLAEPLVGSSGGGVGAARVAGMRVRGLGEPPEPPLGTTWGQESSSLSRAHKDMEMPSFLILSCLLTTLCNVVRFQ